MVCFYRGESGGNSRRFGVFATWLRVKHVIFAQNSLSLHRDEDLWQNLDSLAECVGSGDYHAPVSSS